MPGYRLIPAVLLTLLLFLFALEARAQTTPRRPPDYNYFDARMGQRQQRRFLKSSCALLLCTCRIGFDVVESQKMGLFGFVLARPC
jgi:hypothetical protein